MTEHTVEQLLAEIHDSEAREADYRNRAEVAEAKFNNVRLFFNSFKIGDQHLISIAADGSITYGKKHAHGEVDDLAFQPGTVQEMKPPEVYRVEDGHTYQVSPWPSMEGKCHLCSHPETIHIQAQL